MAAVAEPAAEGAVPPPLSDLPPGLVLGEPWRGLIPRRVDSLPCGALLIISQGSVIDFTGDALVNAANEYCLGGGGVDGAVNAAGGWRLQDARYALPLVPAGDGAGGGLVRCPTGTAVATIGGDLAVDTVIHAVGPDYRMFTREPKVGDALLESAYKSALQVARSRQVTTLASSLLSSAIYRGKRPLLHVLRIAVRAVRDTAGNGLREVHLVAFTQDELETLLLAADAEFKGEPDVEDVPSVPPAEVDAAAGQGAVKVLSPAEHLPATLEGKETAQEASAPADANQL